MEGSRSSRSSSYVRSRRHHRFLVSGGELMIAPRGYVEETAAIVLLGVATDKEGAD